MRAGELRHLVTIQQRSVTRDDFGAESEVWTTFSQVWAKVQPLSGQELEHAQAMHSETTHKITIRYLADMTPEMRIQHDSRTLEILSIKNLDERSIQLELLCREWE
ncbi:phage head closure protein [Thalassoglobus sp.]|uniref:phage head closure protein n=1 Tax=Thalassoglobus sp. TaxID=2795869 RepID=UPI003AA7B3C6